MIASPALTLAATSLAPGIQSAIDVGEGAEAPNFAALLAQVTPTDVLGTAVSPAPQSDSPLPEDHALVPAQAATTGKTLPPALPDVLPETLPDQMPGEADAVPPEAPPPTDAKPERAVPLALPQLIAKLTSHGASPADEAVIEQDAEQEEAIRPDHRDTAAAIALPAFMPPVAVAIVQTRSQAAAQTGVADPVEQPRSRSAELSTVPQAKINLPAADPKLLAMDRPSAAQQIASPPVSAAPASAAQPALQPLSQVRLDVAAPEPLRVQRGEPPHQPLSMTARLFDEAEPVQPALLPVSAPLAASHNAEPALQAPTMTRPYDFAALVDRLVAAREAAQPQAVSVSLPHAEFGQVRLHFRNEDGALAVSLASADPDFARIAAQAAPPVLAVGEARNLDANSGQQSMRGDGQNAAPSQGGNPRGQSHERRGEPQARFEHHPQRRTGPQNRADRNDIFA